MTITWHSQFGCQSTATSWLQFTGTTINGQSMKLDSQPTFSQSVRDSLAWQSDKTENGAGEWWGQVHGCIFLIMLLGSCQSCHLVMFVCLPHFPHWKKTGEQRIWIWIIHKRSKISADSFTDSWGPDNGRSFFPNLQKTCRGYRNPAFIIPWWYCSQISQAQGLQWLPCNRTIQNTHFLPVH